MLESGEKVATDGETSLAQLFGDSPFPDALDLGHGKRQRGRRWEEYCVDTLPWVDEKCPHAKERQQLEQPRTGRPARRKRLS